MLILWKYFVKGRCSCFGRCEIVIANALRPGGN